MFFVLSGMVPQRSAEWWSCGDEGGVGGVGGGGGGVVVVKGDAVEVRWWRSPNCRKTNSQLRR